jgi:hypothetical protein
MEDWYRVTQADFEKLGCYAFTRTLFKSYPAALMSIFPDHAWEPWKFRGFSLAKGHEQLPKYVAELSSFLGVKKLDDWYQVTYDQIKQFGSPLTPSPLRMLSLILYFYLGQGRGIKKLGLGDALKIVYPHHEWDSKRFVLNE